MTLDLVFNIEHCNGLFKHRLLRPLTAHVANDLTATSNRTFGSGVEFRHYMGFAKLYNAHLNRRLFRDSWLMAVQPISFMSRSISLCMRPSACSTPAWPATDNR